MKKTFISIVATSLILIQSDAFSQFKLFSNGNLTVGSITQHDSSELQVTGALNANTLSIYSNAKIPAIYSGINWVNDTSTKAWAVKNNSTDKFYVKGNGQAYSFGWNTLSDSSLKENVKSIVQPLKKVLQLNGVTYNLKNSPTEYASTNGRKMGLIAQSVEQVIPEVVTTTDKGMKTIAYGNLTALLIEAIKEEDAKVNLLQHRLDSCIASNNRH